MIKKGSCFVICCMIFLLASCGLKKEALSFNALLEAADLHITTGDGGSASKVLKSARDSAQSPLQFLGIYKRQIKIGDTKEAEKTLKAGMRDYSENKELKAVYSWFLYQYDSLSQAKSQAKKLAGTETSSVVENISRAMGTPLSRPAVMLTPRLTKKHTMA